MFLVFLLELLQMEIWKGKKWTTNTNNNWKICFFLLEADNAVRTDSMSRTEQGVWTEWIYLEFGKKILKKEFFD